MWFGCAAVAAVAAVLALRAHVASLEATRPDVGPPTAVVAAAADLTRGSILDAESLSIVDVPSTLVPPGLADLARARRPGGCWPPISPRGRSSRRRASRAPAAGRSRPWCRPACGRSCSRPVRRPAPSGPGDEIDVLATYGANAGRPYTETVASGLEVLDVVEGGPPVGRRAGRNDDRPADRGARRPPHGRTTGARREPGPALDRDRRRRARRASADRSRSPRPGPRRAAAAELQPTNGPSP